MKLLKNVKKVLKLWNKEYKKGFFSYIILLLLKDKPRYGFEISNKISEITLEKVTFQESGIYHILKKLEDKGFVTAEWRPSNKGPNRKYYTITESGEQLLKIFTKDYILPINNAVNKLIEKHFSDLK